MGIATRIAVRLTPLPPTVATLLADFSGMAEAAAAVTGIIAAGIVPAALEMMDAAIVEVVEAYVHAGLPTDAAAVLLVEVDGLADGVASQTERVRDVLLRHQAPPGPGGGRRRPSGPCGGRAASRPSAPSPVSPPTTTSTTAWCPAPGWSRCSARWIASLAARPHPRQRVPRRRWQPAPADRVRPAGPGRAGAGPCRRPGDHRGLRGCRGLAVGRARHRPGEAGFHAPGVLRRRPGRPAPGCATPSTPTGRCNPEKVLPRGGSRCGDIASLPEGAWV